MRIGIDARFYGTLGKGLGRYTEKLIQELEKLPGEDRFYVFLRQENFTEYIPRDKRFTKVLADFPWYGWQEQTLFPILLLRYRLDLVHFPHFNVPILYWRPLVVTIHDLILLHYPTVKASELPPLLYWVKYRMYRLVIAVAVWRARRIFAVSQFTADDLARAYPSAEPKIRVTYEAAEQSCFWIEATVAEAYLKTHGLGPRGRGQPYVLYVGNAYPHKNLELLLMVAEHVPEKLFVCVGRADFFYQRIKREALERKLNNVRFIGFVPDPLLSVLYREAESYFFPSLYEGFGLPALEACAHGTPVLALKAGALPEILGEAGRLLNTSDTMLAAQAIRELGEDTEGRKQLIVRGYARVSQFSWRRMAHTTLKEYHESISYARHSTPRAVSPTKTSPNPSA